MFDHRRLLAEREPSLLVPRGQGLRPLEESPLPLVAPKALVVSSSKRIEGVDGKCRVGESVGALGCCMSACQPVSEVAALERSGAFTVEVEDARQESDRRTYRLMVRACRDGERTSCFR